MDTKTKQILSQWDEQSLRTISRRAGENDDLLNFRLKAFERLKQTPWPHMLQEAWRRSNPREIGRRRFGLWMEGDGTMDRTDESAESEGHDSEWSVLEQSGFKVTKHQLHKSAASADVRFSSLNSAASDIKNRLIETMRDFPEDNESPAISLLHNAFFQGGSFLSIPDGREVKAPFLIRHVLGSSGSTLMPLNIIQSGKGSRSTVLLDQIVTGESEQWINTFSRIEVGENAQLNLVVINRTPPVARLYDHQSIRLGRNARLNLVWADLTQGWSVIRRETDMSGIGSEADLRGIHIGSGESYIDLRSLQDHPQPASMSNLLYKTVMFERSKSVYQGLIKVHPEANGTNAYQMNRNLLMNPKAHADTIPKLEIMVDEVKCSHGASVGKIDSASLFYLMSRGLPRSEAMRLMVEGFLGEVSDRIVDQTLRDYWMKKVFQYMSNTFNN